MAEIDELLPGLWTWTAPHPDWHAGDRWPQQVSSWAVRTDDGLVLIDPIVEAFGPLDELVRDHGVSAILRTLHYHHRSISGAARRYETRIWSRAPRPSSGELAASPSLPFDVLIPDAVCDLPFGLTSFPVHRDDEIAVWLPAQRAAIIADVLLRTPDGALEACPADWVSEPGGLAQVADDLEPLDTLGPEHVLVAHGPQRLGDGAGAISRTLA